MLKEESNGKIYNVCGDDPREMGFYTDVLIKLSGLKDVVKEVHPPFYRPIDIHYQHGDCDDLVKLTGWKAHYDIETTLSDLLQYWVKKTKA